jgi:thiol peroxidase
MSTRIFTYAAACLAAFLLIGCGAKQAPLVVDSQSSVPGTQVTRKGEVLALVGTGIQVGQKLPATSLIDAMTMQPVNLADNRGRVLFLSIVPSLDTRVCEEQTHYLGEQGDRLPAAVRRITISRDTPFAQARFAEEARLKDIEYLSDYKEGEFGRSVGLLIESSRLLARAVLLVDAQGVVRYIQVVPDTTHLPDMEKAFAEAEELAKNVK